MTGAFPSGEHDLFPFRRVQEDNLFDCWSWASEEKAKGKVTVCHLQQGDDLVGVKTRLKVDPNRSTHVLIVVGLPPGAPAKPHIDALVEAYKTSEKATRVKLNSPFLDSYRQGKLT